MDERRLTAGLLGTLAKVAFDFEVWLIVERSCKAYWNMV